MTGVLYGIGLGPGDPELMTLKAHRLISQARVVAYPTLAGASSFARSIAADVIQDDAQEIVMDVPMTTERAPAQAAYDTGAAQIAAAPPNTICDPSPVVETISMSVQRTPWFRHRIAFIAASGCAPRKFIKSWRRMECTRVASFASAYTCRGYEPRSLNTR